MSDSPLTSSRSSTRFLKFQWGRIALGFGGILLPSLAVAQTPITSGATPVASSPMTASEIAKLEQRYPPEVLQCAECRRRLGLPALPGLKSDPSHGRTAVAPPAAVSDRLPPPTPTPILNSPNAAPYVDPDFRSLTPLASAAMQRAGQRRAMNLPRTALPPSAAPTAPAPTANHLPPTPIAPQPIDSTSSSTDATPMPPSMNQPIASPSSIEGLPSAVQKQILSELEVPDGGRILSYGFQGEAPTPKVQEAEGYEPASRALDLPHPSLDTPRTNDNEAKPTVPMTANEPIKESKQLDDELPWKEALMKSVSILERQNQLMEAHSLMLSEMSHRLQEMHQMLETKLDAKPDPRSETLQRELQMKEAELKVEMANFLQQCREWERKFNQQNAIKRDQPKVQEKKVLEKKNSKKNETEKKEPEKNDAEKNDFGKSEVGKSEVGKSEVEKSEVGKGDVEKSEVGN